MEIQYLLASRTPSAHHHGSKLPLTHLHTFASTSNLPNGLKFPLLQTHQRFNLYRKRVCPFRPFSPSSRTQFTIKAKVTSSGSEDVSPSSSSNTKLVVGYSAATILLAVANRVLYKLALVPMKEYPFFLAQITTFGPNEAGS